MPAAPTQGPHLVADPLSRLTAALGDRFAIERELGHGGMATVYLARDAKHDRRVAIKVLRPELAAALGGERFLREIRIAAQLAHPNILPLYDSGAADELLYYVMPYVEGETLRDRLERDGPLPVPAAVQLVAQVASALDYAHGRGIVHRDIKPENILLQSGQAVVSDFGIARAVDVAATDGFTAASLTGTGVMVGTPLYMSPEQIAGGAIEGRCDIYSLACVLYETLTGEPPFTGTTPQAVLIHHSVDRPPSVRTRRPEVPEHLDQLLERALAKDPDQRPSAAAFRDSLLGDAPPLAAGRRVRGRVAIVAAVAALGLLAYWGATRARGTSADPSVAVLPFVNQSADTGTEYFAAGMTDAVIDALAGVRGLRVASHTSVFAASKARLDSRATGAALHVATLVEGSTERQGTAIRVSARLVRAADDSILWAYSYHGDRRDVFAVQDSISRAVVRALQVRLGGGEAPPLVRSTTANPAAYDLYLKGRFFWSQRAAGPAPLRHAIDDFQQAIALDSSYARAWAGLADAYSLLPAFGDAPPRESFAHARVAAQRAVTLDSTLADAHRSLGIIAVFYDWDWATAAREFDRALALDSTEALTHLFRTWLYRFSGRPEEALREIRAAQRLDPVSPIINARVGVMLRVLRRYGEAEAGLRQAIELDSTNVSARMELGLVLTNQHRYAEALATFPRNFDLSPGFSGAGPIGYTYAMNGQRAEALAVQRRLEQRARERYIAPEAFALIAVGLGDTARALEWLERGHRERSFFAVFLDEPLYDPLRAQPRFQRLQREVLQSLPPTAR